MPRTKERNCSGCRYWSEMLAQAGGGTDNPRGDLEAMCLNGKSPKRNRYTTAETTCPAYAKNSHGAVDDPPDYGEQVRKLYAEEAAKKYPNGAPMYAPDGMMLDGKGNRSIFDDVDE